MEEFLHTNKRTREGGVNITRTRGHKWVAMTRQQTTLGVMVSDEIQSLSCKVGVLILFPVAIPQTVSPLAKARQMKHSSLATHPGFTVVYPLTDNFNSGLNKLECHKALDGAS